MNAHLSHLLDFPISLRFAWQRIGMITAGVILLAFLMLFRQTLYPPPWFDEGLNVSTAAMLARYGLYALPDSQGLRLIDPAIQTGPTVLLPIALVFDLFGAGLAQARLTMIPFALLMLVAFAWVARHLVGPAALLATIFLVAGTLEPYASFLYMSRQVLGEVPALGMYLIGLLFWWRAVHRKPKRFRDLAFAGIAWGLAMVTKNQVLLLLPVSLALLFLLDRIYYHQTTWPMFVVPGMLALTCVAAWYATQLVIVGPEQFQHNAEILREGFNLHILSFSLIHLRHGLGVIWRTGWWLWGFPGVLWGLQQAREKNFYGFSHASTLVFLLAGLFWFVGLSVGWGRYGFYPIILSLIWTAGLFNEWWHRKILTHSTTGQIMVAGLLGIFIVINSWSLVRNLIIAPTDRGYEAMHDYLATQVPANAVIETWEWEMSLNATQPMHHPSTRVTNEYTEHIYGGVPLSMNVYDPLQAQPRYILTGVYSNWTHIYCGVLTLDNGCQKLAPGVRFVVGYGEYGLYELVPPEHVVR